MSARTICLLVALLAAAPVHAIDLARGQRLFNLHCAACHGQNGVPVAPNAPSFAMRERLDQPDLMLMQSVKMGKNTMPPFFGLLKDMEIADILQYVRTLR
jgi:cytochrome c6